MEKSNGSGWIKLHRQLRDNWLYQEKRRYSKFEAWLDLLMEVNHTEAKIVIKGILFEVKRGQSINSLETWANRWDWSVSKTRRFLFLLQKENMIEYKNETQTIRITVCKYDSYQSTLSESENQMETKWKPNGNQMKTNKKEKKEKNEKTPIQAQRLEGEHFNFNTIEKQTIEQELDVKLFWERLLKIYNPEGDKAIHNTVLKKQREKIIGNFSSEEREKILEWFGKYKTQLEILGPWIGNFFKDHKTIESIAEYFRSIKNVKESDKKKYSTKNELTKWVGHSPEDY